LFEELQSVLGFGPASTVRSRHGLEFVLVVESVFLVNGTLNFVSFQMEGISFCVSVRKLARRWLI
jgi:hypothetical protein